MSLKTSLTMNKKMWVNLTEDFFQQADQYVTTFLAFHGYSIEFPSWWSWDWMREHSPDGFDGALPKRISKLHFQQHGRSISVETQSVLGEAFKRFAPTQEGECLFDFDDKLDWEPGDFGDSVSCFFTQYRRPALKHIRDAGGFAVRRWITEKEGIGRCWALPAGEGLVVINCYDKAGTNLAGYARAVARILKTDLLEVKPIGYVDGSAHIYNDTLFVNGQRGFFIGPLKEMKALLPSSEPYELEANRYR